MYLYHTVSSLYPLDKGKTMSIREFTQKYPVVAVVLAVVVVGFAVYRVAGGKRGGSGNLRWFYDVQTGQLFSHDGNALPPIAAPSGGEGVRAHVFTCGNCSNAADRQIAYLEKNVRPETPTGDATTPTNPNPGQMMMLKEGRQLVAQPDTELKWIALESPAGMRLTRMADRCPDPKKLQMCQP